MAINRFAILTDGFSKPGVIVGNDWASAIGRALLLTEGYFPRAITGVIVSLFGRWIPRIPTWPNFGKRR